MYSENRFPRCKPEEVGISSNGILSFLNSIEKDGLVIHGFLIYKDGFIASEGWWAPYGGEYKHSLFSVTKSFTSTAIGIAADKGLLSVDDNVLPFFPEYKIENINQNLADMRIKNLLTMTTGRSGDSIGFLYESKTGDWVRTFLEITSDVEPGSVFAYDTGASYILSAIVQKVTGVNVGEFLRKHLFKHLDIEDFYWNSCPKGVKHGGSFLSLRLEDMVKLGILYLQKGTWKGKRIISEEWVNEATSLKMSTEGHSTKDWQYGYGYQFWLGRHNSFMAFGYFGQFFIVIPEKNAVIAVNSGDERMDEILDNVWSHLYPAIGERKLLEDEKAYAELQSKISGLKAAIPCVNSTSLLIKIINGKEYIIDENKFGVKGIKFEFDEKHTIFKLKDEKCEHNIICGNGGYLKNEITVVPFDEIYHQLFELCIYENYYRENEKYSRKHPAAACCTWYDENTFAMTWVLYETTFIQTVVCAFQNDRIIINFKENLAYRTKETPVLTGRIEEH